MGHSLCGRSRSYGDARSLRLENGPPMGLAKNDVRGPPRRTLGIGHLAPADSRSITHHQNPGRKRRESEDTGEAYAALDSRFRGKERINVSRTCFDSPVSALEFLQALHRDASD